MRILLLEDNSTDAGFLQELLVEASKDKDDWSVTHVEDLANALDCIRQSSFDVVLSDLWLPDAQQLDAVHQIHAIAPNVPIIVLTAAADEAIGLAALQHGAQDYLSKGQIDRNSLMRAIRYAIERSQTQQLMHQQEVERAEAEAHLTRIRKAVESTSDAIVITDLSGKLTYQNQAFLSLYGYTLDEVNQLGGLTSLIVEPEQRQQVADVVQSGHSWSGEVGINASNHRILTTLLRVDRIHDEDGNCLGLINVCTDISRRKQTEEEVRLLQAMTQAIFESEDFHSALAVALQKVGEATAWNFGEAWIPRADGMVLECSPAWYCSTPELEPFRELSKQLTFAPGVGIPGRVWVEKRPEWRRDVSQETNQVYQRTDAARQVGLKSALGIPILASKTVLAVLVFYMFESKSEDARLIELISASTQLGLAIQRKRAEEEVRQALEKERELNDLKSRIVSRTSHEFRTPLTVISTSVGLLKNYSHKWAEDKKAQHFQRIQTAIERITHLLDDVLFLEKGEAGKQEFQPHSIDLVAFCRELVEELQLSIGRHHLIAFACESDRSTACIDKKLVHLILSNLLSNAIKYSSQGSTVYFRLACHAESAVFQIEDSGIGIPPEGLPRLFESFYRAGNVGNISGTGLGLAIVKQSVDLHQGTIDVTSQSGVGTTFTVILPIVPSSQSHSFE